MMKLRFNNRRTWVFIKSVHVMCCLEVEDDQSSSPKFRYGCQVNCYWNSPKRRTSSFVFERHLFQVKTVYLTYCLSNAHGLIGTVSSFTSHLRLSSPPHLSTSQRLPSPWSTFLGLGQINFLFRLL